ncbi:TPA: zinc ribbon domain-containing protein [Candidatus Nomurabacteria bacterium]|nr:MAG: hypothetical protein O210_OD1C00001G0606 [Parcubacteria bacterium RAAC4_OD1_1]HCY26172.1 zinc ribbon domain-containing protein [Candidatus Nomurabacteria bacterium]
MKYCINCGFKLIDSAKFCSSCGNKCEQDNSKDSYMKNKDIVDNSQIENIDHISDKNKTYKAEEQIKSSKWNSFLLNTKDVEEYLKDGVNDSHSEFLYLFSKSKRENNERRNKRMLELLNLRKCEINDSYYDNNVKPIDKKIISLILNKDKGLFSKDVSSYLNKETDEKNIVIKKMIFDGNIESGEIILSCPVFTSIEYNEKAVLFITERGLGFIKINNDDVSSISVPYAIASAAGPLLGIVATGIATIAGKYIADSVNNFKIDKNQQKVIDLVNQYSISLTAKCFNGSQFVPFSTINALLYGDYKKGYKSIRLLYENVRKDFNFIIEDHVWDCVFGLLSKENLINEKTSN